MAVWRSSIPQSTSEKMFTDSTNLDVDSTDYERCIQTELDPLIQRNEKGPTKKEARIARAQFLALCWVLFVVGWIDGSTGPLLPRIQSFYDVSWRFSLRLFFNLLWILQIGFGTVSWVFMLQCTVSDHYRIAVTTTSHRFSGSSCGSIAQYDIERQTGFRKREL